MISGIGAILKCYTDIECTQELNKESTAYSIKIGPESGFNGTDGDYLMQTIYVKNVGDSIATDIEVTEVGDENGYFKMNSEGSLIVSNTLKLKNLEPEEKTSLNFYSIIPEGSLAASGYLDWTITYDTVPAMSLIPYYIDAENPDILTAISVSSQKGNFEEYSFKETSKTLNSKLHAPLSVEHGSIEEVEWDPGTADYKIRFKCSHCGTYTDWYGIHDKKVDFHVGIPCSNCTLNVKSGVSTVVDNLRKYVGKAYGKGGYGKPLYGQEGFLHITDTLLAEVPIKGKKRTTIVGYFLILAKYNGSEESIEDIQSFYTNRYMALACYDGPALPLWTKRKNVYE